MKNFRNATVHIAEEKIANTVKHIDESRALTAVWVYVPT